MVMVGCTITSAKKESILRDDLLSMRSIIGDFTLEKHRRPRSLDELISAGYLKGIPTDPMTGRNDTWKVDIDGSSPSAGVRDIHSGSGRLGSDGKPYSVW